MVFFSVKVFSRKNRVSYSILFLHYLLTKWYQSWSRDLIEKNRVSVPTVAAAVLVADTPAIRELLPWVVNTRCAALITEAKSGNNRRLGIVFSRRSVRRVYARGVGGGVAAAGSMASTKGSYLLLPLFPLWKLAILLRSHRKLPGVLQSSAERTRRCTRLHVIARVTQ